MLRIVIKSFQQNTFKGFTYKVKALYHFKYINNY